MLAITLGAGITSTGIQVLDRGTGLYTPLQNTLRSYITPSARPAVPLPREKVIRQTSSRLPTAYEQQAALIRNAKSTKTSAQIQAEGQARLQEARRKSEAARIAKLAQQEAAERAAKLREQRIQAVSPTPPAKRAGVRAWESWYAAIGRPMPHSVRQTEQGYDQAAFYNAVAGKFWIADQPGINRRPGVGWMFSVAYGGETMPYWEAWYDRSMSVADIAHRVAADYIAEIQRLTAVQDQYRQLYETWDDAGQVSPKPVRTPFIQQPQQRAALPSLPSIQGRAALPSLPSIQRRAALPSLPVLRGKSELPPLIF